MILYNKTLLYIALAATAVTAPLNSGCSFNHLASDSPEPDAALETAIIAADQKQETPLMTITPAPQAVEIAASPLRPIAAASKADADSQYLDVRKECTFTATNNRSEFFHARDISMESAWIGYPGEQSITIDVENSINDIKGIYIKWDASPPTWNLYAYDSDGNEILADSGGDNCGWTEFAEVPASMSAYKKFKIVATNPEIAFAIANISVYAGGVPEFVPLWEPYNGDRVDLLIISAHPDDESVFLAAPAVAYSNEGKSVVTAYMTWGTSDRRYEAEEACWMLGDAYAPTMRKAHDMMTNSLESMQRYWSLDKAVGYIVELIRKYKPSVLVTHDVGGEYGHGAHIETSYATQLAFTQASDPLMFPESAEKYGVWKPGKLYLHMYSEDKITFDLQVPLDKFNEKTILQTATAAFERHQSQAAKGWTVESTGKSSMEYFGLFASNIGPDTKHESMFENVTPSIMDQINGYDVQPNP